MTSTAQKAVCTPNWTSTCLRPSVEPLMVIAIAPALILPLVGPVSPAGYLMETVPLYSCKLSLTQSVVEVFRFW